MSSFHQWGSATQKEHELKDLVYTRTIKIPLIKMRRLKRLQLLQLQSQQWYFLRISRKWISISQENKNLPPYKTFCGIYKGEKGFNRGHG